MFVEENMAEPESSSESTTEPVAQLFELFDVVAVNAAREYCMIAIDTTEMTISIVTPTTASTDALETRAPPTAPPTITTFPTTALPIVLRRRYRQRGTSPTAFVNRCC